MSDHHQQHTTDTPLSSNDYGKLLVFTLLLTPSVILLVGAIPALFLVFGIFMMKKHRDFAHIETAARNYKIYCGLITLGFLVATSYFAIEYFYNIDSDYEWRKFYAGRAALLALMGSVIPLIAVVLLELLLLSPLRGHRNWLEKNGFFTGRDGQPVARPKDIDIIKGERMRTFSVADELLKWAKLKEDGHVTDQEFSDARRRLLERP